jgi:hypothetical protein
VTVNGHELPRALAELAQAGQWQRLTLNAPPVEIEEPLVPRTGSEMGRNTQVLADALAAGDGALFGLAEAGGGSPGLLDITQAVVIAATFGEEFLALDYSAGDPPRVVATADQAEGVRWVEVAPRFERLIPSFHQPERE